MAKSSKYGEVTVQDDSLMNPLNGTDEPVFILRARDTSSLATIQAHIEDNSARGTDEDYLAGVAADYDRFEAWQREHADEIKLPD